MLESHGRFGVRIKGEQHIHWFSTFAEAVAYEAQHLWKPLLDRAHAEGWMLKLPPFTAQLLDPQRRSA